MAKPKGLGGIGEDLATKYLTDAGFTILSRNFRSRFGEIDIIAKNEDFLCFVEVKTRNVSKNLATGLESVTVEKQKKIYKTAEYFITTHMSLVERDNLQPRFDCLEIKIGDDGVVEINFIENAFSFN